MTRAQFTMEFVLIFMLSFMVFLLVLALVVRVVDSNRASSEQRKIELLADRIKNDLVLAQDSGSTFESRIVLPRHLGGSPYDIGIDHTAGILFLKNNITNATVYKAIPQLTGGFRICCENIIKKEGGGISVEPQEPCVC